MTFILKMRYFSNKNMIMYEFTNIRSISSLLTNYFKQKLLTFYINLIYAFKTYFHKF